MKKISPVTIFGLLLIIGFAIYDKVLIKIILFLNLPFAPNTRTVQAAILKYLPLLIILSFIYFLLKKFSERGGES